MTTKTLADRVMAVSAPMQREGWRENLRLQPLIKALAECIRTASVSRLAFREAIAKLEAVLKEMEE
jgi:hypothetical protein